MRSQESRASDLHRVPDRRGHGQVGAGPPGQAIQAEDLHVVQVGPGKF